MVSVLAVDVEGQRDVDRARERLATFETVFSVAVEVIAIWRVFEVQHPA
jgi:hypothetical protein